MLGLRPGGDVLRSLRRRPACAEVVEADLSVLNVEVEEVDLVLIGA